MRTRREERRAFLLGVKVEHTWQQRLPSVTVWDETERGERMKEAREGKGE